MFDGFAVFKPSDPALDGLLSEHDLNCATSSPNAVYGTRYNRNQFETPRIMLDYSNVTAMETNRTFTLHHLKIKPLDMPFAYTKLTLKGRQVDGHQLEWNVDFPAGFHDMFKVDITGFSGQKWNNLQYLDIMADFVNGGQFLDWEFCLDDLEVSLNN